MALDSLASASVVSSLDPTSQTVLNTVFTDTNNGSLKNTPLVAGTLLTSTGSGGVVNGALITNSNNPLVTTIQMGGSGDTKITMPGGVGNVVAFESSAQPTTLQQVASDLTNKAVQAYGPDVAPGNGTNGILTVSKLLSSGQLGDVVLGNSYNTNILYAGASSNTVIAGGGNNIIGLDYSTSNNYLVVAGAGNDTVIGASSSNSLVHTNASIINATGNATIVAGIGNTTMGGDRGNQVFIGGNGDDVLVGGGGRDTLTGGAGKDVFIFDAVGHYTVTDFKVGTDTLAFTSLQGLGINSLTDLLSRVTSATNNGANAVVNFGTESSITLVGVSVEQLQTQFIKFFMIN